MLFSLCFGAAERTLCQTANGVPCAFDMVNHACSETYMAVYIRSGAALRGIRAPQSTIEHSLLLVLSAKDIYLIGCRP